MSTVSIPSHVQLMDRMYALQRHVYDLTRKYYLFGRDRLIDRMTVAPQHNVLEIGCGTGRNLILLAKKHANSAPSAKFFGLDAAHVMIDTAQSKITRRHLQNQIALRQALAEDLAPALFNVEKFDRIFFSYSLSMIPTWPAALETALQHLAPDGELWIVDFWDQSDWPFWFRGSLKSWLKLFHVHFRPELLAHLQHMHTSQRGTLALESVGNRYAYLARWTNAV